MSINKFKNTLWVLKSSTHNIDFQGLIQDFLEGGRFECTKGFDLLILPDYSLIFPDFRTKHSYLKAYSF